MPRDNFEKELRLLNRELILMASECETLIAKASRVVMKGEMDLIDTVPDEYQALLEKENSVSHLCQHLFILQQPVARDCDFILTAMKMGMDLKAIGDYGMQIVQRMNQQWGWMDVMDIEGLALSSIHLVTRSIDSFVQADAELAHKVVASRKTIDADFQQIKDRLVQRWKRKEMNEEQVIDRILIANDFCHIAHHANNIGQWVLDGLRKDVQQ